MCCIQPHLELDLDQESDCYTEGTLSCSEYDSSDDDGSIEDASLPKGHTPVATPSAPTASQARTQASTAPSSGTRRNIQLGEEIVE